MPYTQVLRIQKKHTGIN